MGIKYGISKEAQDHGRAKDALKSAKKETLEFHILERCENVDTYRRTMTEQELREDDIRRRDEEGNINRVHFSNVDEQQWWENTSLHKDELLIWCSGYWSKQ